ncbi:hypothetical protein TSUD_129750 [Trifolium subterraneum]|uniref:Disease resistance protein At4g27190-like leucine-rich repeats domain-containing protein n=1 Tax=Trifolium subterraneum TaxID=3900 RepID=A0A2Z6LYW3_TRISU|nr:hypothetical protein TSUD_129750 [Trifolium subterraneum]
MVPHLEVLELLNLYNLIGMFPDNCQAKWPSQSVRTLTIEDCPKLAIPWFNLKVGYDQRQHRLNDIWSPQCLQSLTLANCEELKCLFSTKTHRSLPELVYLRVLHCKELEQIVAVNEELVQFPNAELYFPKLKEIKVYHCNKLKSLFPLSMVTMLPQLTTLHLSKSTQLQEGKLMKEAASEDDEDFLSLLVSNIPNYAQSEKSKAKEDDEDSHYHLPSIHIIFSKSPDHRLKGKVLNNANQIDDAKDISMDKGRELTC